MLINLRRRITSNIDRLLTPAIKLWTTYNTSLPTPVNDHIVSKMILWKYTATKYRPNKA
jgi:hypothetical protein